MINDKMPNLVAISSMTNWFVYVREIAVQDKKASKAIAVSCGGVTRELTTERGLIEDQ